VAAEPPPQPEPEPVSEEVIDAIYDRLYAFVEGVATSVQANQTFPVDQGFQLVSELVDTQSATDVLHRRAIYTRESSDQDQGFSAAVVLHSVNVCIYAVKIGEGLKFDRDQLIDLGVAGLVHDVGMVKLPIEFFTKGQLDQSDIDRLHMHPIDGHGILAQLGDQTVGCQKSRCRNTNDTMAPDIRINWRATRSTSTLES
jgi:HD-GYP domain-containing protein (c-di-GMP phosphodiesterase class II)